MMNAASPEPFSHLPGGEYVTDGIAALQAGEITLPALVLAIASSRLKAAGLPLPERQVPEPELQLYRLLRKTHGDDAHSQYQAHLRRLDRLCRALETRR